MTSTPPEPRSRYALITIVCLTAGVLLLTKFWNESAAAAAAAMTPAWFGPWINAHVRGDRRSRLWLMVSGLMAVAAATIVSGGVEPQGMTFAAAAAAFLGLVSAVVDGLFRPGTKPREWAFAAVALAAPWVIVQQLTTTEGQGLAFAALVAVLTIGFASWAAYDFPPSGLFRRSSRPTFPDDVGPVAGWCFRRQLKLPDDVRLGFGVPYVHLTPSTERPLVALRAVMPGLITDTRDLLLSGYGYPTEAEAAQAAERWRSALTVALASVHTGVNFGDRDLPSQLTPAGQEELQARFGVPRVEHAAPLVIYNSHPVPVFNRMSVQSVLTKGIDPIISSLRRSASEGTVVAATEQLAFDLYSASFREETVDARMLMLMMAVETMLDPAIREPAAVAFVDDLINQVRASSLTKPTKDSLIGSLRWLRNDSISQTGRAAAQGLSPNEYGGKAPDEFFRDCYELRSRLAHGHQPRPDVEHLNQVNGQLARFVADLIVHRVVTPSPTVAHRP